jgi:hypothetical protein
MSHPHETPEAQAALKAAIESMRRECVSLEALKHLDEAIGVGIEAERLFIGILTSLLTTAKACKCDCRSKVCDSFRGVRSNSRDDYYCGDCCHDEECHAPKEQ